jgi:hypothetical protein
MTGEAEARPGLYCIAARRQIFCYNQNLAAYFAVTLTVARRRGLPFGNRIIGF